MDCVGTTRFRITERSTLDGYNTAKVLCPLLDLLARVDSDAQIETIEDLPATEEALAEADGIIQPLIDVLREQLTAPGWAQLEERMAPMPEDIGLKTFWYVYNRHSGRDCLGA